MTQTLFERAAHTMKKIGGIVLVGGSAILSGCSDKTNSEPAPRPGMQQTLQANSYKKVGTHNMLNNVLLPNAGETKAEYEKEVARQNKAIQEKNNRDKQRIEKEEDFYARALLESNINKNRFQSIFTQKGLLAYKEGKESQATALKRTYDPNTDQVLALVQKMDPSQKILDNTAKTDAQAKKQKMLVREMAELLQGDETDY